MLGDYAKVELVPAVAETIAIGMQALANVPKGPGLPQDDAVQLAARWAFYRDRIMIGAVGLGRIAVWDKGGKFAGVVEGGSEAIGKYFKAHPEADPKSARLIVGDGPMASPYPGGKGLPDNWAELLARALDNTTIKIAKAPRGGGPPVGLTGFSQLVGAPVVVGIIVGGAALAVIGSVAAWRFFDPELRKHTASLHAAAAAYDSRIAVAKETGKLPPPSPVELGAKDMVEKAAKEETNRSLAIGLGIAGGITAAAVGVAAIRHYT